MVDNNRNVLAYCLLILEEVMPGYDHGIWL